ncbi:MAG: HAD family acid phosphatase [Lachnospiraceae bacterium]|nr:HAD family acid phosphatase [Lachnospiraceae bacterium]
MENDSIILSTLGHTWILDLDGTIVKHNGYKIDGEDTLLPGAMDFFAKIPDKDMIIFITARKSEYRDETEKFLLRNGIRYNHIIFDAPYGERILVNDDKPSGLKMGLAINTKRDSFGIANVIEDENI